jgi:hypothetical protein
MAQYAKSLKIPDGGNSNNPNDPNNPRDPGNVNEEFNNPNTSYEQPSHSPPDHRISSYGTAEPSPNEPFPQQSFVSHQSHATAASTPESRSAFRNEIVTYFANPNMTKIKDVQTFSMYMSKTYCLLSKECRYLVAFTYRDTAPKGVNRSLDDLEWVSFQTQTLADNHELPPHSYQAKRVGPLTAEIQRGSNTPNASTYSCADFPVVVTLLHTDKGIAEYQNKGTIVAALETYRTILVWSG